VVPTRSVPQGIAALMQFTPDNALDTVRAAMERGMTQVQSGEITQATRSVELNGVTVAEGQIIGLHNGALTVAGDDVQDTLLRLLEAMEASSGEVISLYYGSELALDQAEAMAQAVREKYPNHSVDLLFGGQPHYPFIVSVE
jgi:hypothetical protein